MGGRNGKRQSRRKELRKRDDGYFSEREMRDDTSPLVCQE
jgi:hypothetical protein